MLDPIFFVYSKRFASVLCLQTASSALRQLSHKPYNQSPGMLQKQPRPLVGQAKRVKNRWELENIQISMYGNKSLLLPRERDRPDYFLVSSSFLASLFLSLTSLPFFFLSFQWKSARLFSACWLFPLRLLRSRKTAHPTSLPTATQEAPTLATPTPASFLLASAHPNRLPVDCRQRTCLR